MNYEINFLILQSQTENVDKIRQEVKKLIESKGGKITDELLYKKRKLAYEIKHEQYGFYTVYRFDLENGEILKDLTKEINLLNNKVARHIIVKSDELPALQKEIGKDDTTKQTKQSKKSKVSAKTAGKKVLDEITQETKEQITQKTSIKNEGKEENLTIEKDKLKKKDSKTEKTKNKEPETKEEKKKEEKTVSTEKKAKKDEISIEDLDKKLDEILDI